MSLETHKPIVDYWSQQSADVRNITDRDCFNAAVQAMRDAELILTQGEFRDDIGDKPYQQKANANINVRYNYATFDPKQYFNENSRILVPAKDVEMVLSAARGLSFNVLGKYGRRLSNRNIWTSTEEKVTYDTVTLVKSQGMFFAVGGKVTENEKQLEEIFSPIFARFPSNATDKQKVEICVKEIVDRFDYETGTAGAIFSWTNGKTKGNCESYTRAASQILAAAGIPNIQAKGSVYNGAHAWLICLVDGSWCVVDATAAEYGYAATMTFGEHEQLYSYSHATNNTDSIKVAKALVEASLS